MASAAGRGRRTDAATIETCLHEARAGRPTPVYLLDGDPFLAERAAREIAAALVPEPQRALNVVELDAATSPAEVAAELATGGLFGGAKVVVVREPAFLQGREDGAAAFARARELWAEGRHREAARRVLAVAAKVGWRAEDLDPSGEGAPDETAWKKELGIELDAAGRAFLGEAARYALERQMKTPRDDSGALDALLARGLPRGHVLIVAAGKIDARLPLAKRLAAAGHRVSIGLAKEGAWGEERPVLGPLIAQLLAGTGKSAERGAEARLAERVGDDARTLAAEVAKLVAYVGERKVIRAADVDEVVTRIASDPFFALGNAVETRDLEKALAVLGRSLEDGASIFMLLGSLAATVRRLIVERERARAAIGDRRLASFAEWSAEVLPRIPEGELGARKPYGFWMKYQASIRFSRAELLTGLADLAEADHAMKTGADGRVLVERALMKLLGSPGVERRTA